jgi:hypothetical protein
MKIEAIKRRGASEARAARVTFTEKDAATLSEVLYHAAKAGLSDLDAAGDRRYAEMVLKLAAVAEALGIGDAVSVEYLDRVQPRKDPRADARYVAARKLLDPAYEPEESL